MVTETIPKSIAKKTDRLLTLKGFGYIITGDALILYSLVMMGILIEHLAPTAKEHPVGIGILIWTLFLIGIAWGVILIWKGFNIIPHKTKEEDERKSYSNPT